MKDLFGFTIKLNNVKDPKHEDYLPLLKAMSTKVEMIDFTYEDKNKKGEKTKLHIHGVFECPRNPYFKTIVPKGVHIKTERIYDIDGWNRYCQKNIDTSKYLSTKIDNTVYMF